MVEVTPQVDISICPQFSQILGAHTGFKYRQRSATLDLMQTHETAQTIV